MQLLVSGLVQDLVQVYVVPNSMPLIRIIYIVSMIGLGTTVGYVAFKTDLELLLRVAIFCCFIVNILFAKKYYK